MANDKFNWKDKEVLISGGTGSLGKALTKILLECFHPKGIRIFSRDEFKQWEMRNELNKTFPKAPVAFLIGDIRDRKRLELATKRVDIFIHASALKQVPSCEDNPLETIQTNIIGAQNVIYASLENNIKKVIGISSDKAVSPINLYGATKMCAEKLFIGSHVYGGDKGPKFSIVRYGNVIGSRGSIVPLFKKQHAETGKITITDKRMTRFWITLEEVSRFILQAIEDMKGSEIFIPRMPSATVLTIARAVCPDSKIEFIGIRPGEKLHESLITKEESIRTTSNMGKNRFEIRTNVNLPSDEFEYTSINNTQWLTVEQIRKMIGDKYDNKTL